MLSYPEVGEWVVLVYRECVCGFWCATGEGSRAPRCPECGEVIPHPFRGTPPNPKDAGEYPALGFAARLLPEVTGGESAVAEVKRRADEAGQPVRVMGPWPPRHYAPEKVQAQVDQITEAV